MAYIVNPPIRDDAIYDAVMKEPSVEPRFLRAYLVDPRNKLHRDEVTKKLSKFYNQPIGHVKQNKKDPELRDGMAKMLESLREADQPIVSVRVTEKNTPVGQEGSRRRPTARRSCAPTSSTGVKRGTFSKQPWGQARFKPPAGRAVQGQPPPIGQQLIAFVEPPEGADKVHFDIEYAVEQGDFGQLRLTVTVEIRTNIEAEPGPRPGTQFTMPSDTFDAGNLDAQVKKLKDELVSRMIGLCSVRSGVGFSRSTRWRRPVFIPRARRSVHPTTTPTSTSYPACAPTATPNPRVTNSAVKYNPAAVRNTK